MLQESIMGGYYLKARKIKDSDISRASPCTREMWDIIMRECLFRDTSKNTLKRGQWLTDRKTILDALAWNVGYRKVTYSVGKYEAAMKVLKKHGMITVTKTVRGIIITVCNYDYYQDPKNYEYRSEACDEDGNKTERYSKNDKNKEEELRKLSGQSETDPDTDPSLKGDKGKPPPDPAEVPPKETPEQKKRRLKRELNKKAAWVINYLNKTTGATYKASDDGVLGNIRARINAGYVAAEFKIVIDRKGAEWKDDPKMCKFLRPSTLFSKQKFPEYLNEVSVAGGGATSY